MTDLTLSKLPKTWLIDVDGTLLKHNGHLEDGDKVLPGVKDFFSKISAKDKVILLTARQPNFAAELEQFLRDQNIRYDQIIFGLPMGERVLINDTKPSGLKTAYAVNVKRDEGLDLIYKIDENL